MKTQDRRAAMAARMLITAGVLWLLFALVFFTDVDCPLTAFLALACTGILIGLVWFAMTGISPRLVRRPAWLSIPLMGAIGVIFLATDLGLALRVALCETALEDFTAKIPVQGVVQEPVGWVGFFEVQKVSVYDGGVYFFAPNSFLNSHGIAHIPPGSEPAPRTSVRHLYGPWYRCTWRF